MFCAYYIISSIQSARFTLWNSRLLRWHQQWVYRYELSSWIASRRDRNGGDGTEQLFHCHIIKLNLKWTPVEEAAHQACKRKRKDAKSRERAKDLISLHQEHMGQRHANGRAMMMSRVCLHGALADPLLPKAITFRPRLKIFNSKKGCLMLLEMTSTWIHWKWGSMIMHMFLEDRGLPKLLSMVIQPTVTKMTSSVWICTLWTMKNTPSGSD